jgi:DNA modification methylase
MAVAAAAKAPEEKKEQLWTLYEGDFKTNAHLILDETVDLVITDLPYGGEVQGGLYRFEGVTTFDESPQLDTSDRAKESLDLLCKETARVLRPNRYCVFFFGFNFYIDLIEGLRKNGLTPCIVPIAWFKNTINGRAPDRRYRHGWEPILYAAKGDAVFIRPGRKDVFQFPVVFSANRLMTVEKPVPLLQEFIMDMSAPGATVLDWMAGSGSTGEAAIKLNRKAILCEKDVVACRMIKARLGSVVSPLTHSIPKP